MAHHLFAVVFKPFCCCFGDGPKLKLSTLCFERIVSWIGSWQVIRICSFQKTSKFITAWSILNFVEPSFYFFRYKLATDYPVLTMLTYSSHLRAVDILICPDNLSYPKKSRLSMLSLVRYILKYSRINQCAISSGLSEKFCVSRLSNGQILWLDFSDIPIVVEFVYSYWISWKSMYEFKNYSRYICSSVNLCKGECGTK